MASFLQNAARLVTCPRLAFAYARYQLSTLRNGGRPTHHLPGGIIISGFSGFSEYQSCAECLNESERVFLSTHDFGEGAVLDVGANLGIVTALLAKRFPERPVHAFEPHPSVVKALRQNCSANRLANVTVARVVVAAKTGQVKFNASSKVRPKSRIGGSGQHVRSIRSVCLDDYIQQCGFEKVALLKVDVEGHEQPVFEGTQQLLKEQRIGTIYYEVCPRLSQKAGFAAGDPTRFLQEYGYQTYRLEERGTLTPVHSGEAGDVQLENWIALR